jgi:hypothetical protein
MTLTKGLSRGVSEGDRALRMSLWLLWWAPLSVVVGFVAASWFLSEAWPLWQVVPLVLILATPFAIGAYYGLRAIKSGEDRGWIGLIIHLILLATALVMPIVESLT